MSDRPDTFRKSYNPLDKMQQALIADIKDAASELFEQFNRTDNEYDARCAHISKSRLEEAVMWAVKGVSNIRGKNGQ